MSKKKDASAIEELAKKLSFTSFGVIGIICLIGILQKRPWLEMFTIGGMSVLLQLSLVCVIESPRQYPSLLLLFRKVFPL
jgi:hypothetical protein